MKKVHYPVYKCLLCKKIIKSAEYSVCIDKESAEQLINEIINNHQILHSLIDTHDIPLYHIHECEDGFMGLAYFAGFVTHKNREKENNENEKK